MSTDERLQLRLPSGETVSALLRLPDDATACCVLGHGAGAGMVHPFMAGAAIGLAERGIGTLRYNFPFAERASKRPDTPPVAHATVRAAVELACTLTPLPLFAGGKSFGGRMTSQAQASAPLPGVRGLVFLGFPLHPADAPGDTRAAHLSRVRVPMLFVQGERDKLALPDRIAPVVERLGPVATLLSIDHADHGFETLVRSGRTHHGVMAEVLDALAAWMNRHAG